MLISLIAMTLKSGMLISSDVFTTYLHSQQSYAAFTFDVEKGRKLELRDFFKENSHYLDTISHYCIDSLSRKLLKAERPAYRLSVLDNIKDGASAREQNYRCFYLTPKGFVIVFPPYQVAAYAAGTQKILIPYEVLKRVMLPEFIERNNGLSE